LNAKPFHHQGVCQAGEGKRGCVSLNSLKEEREGGGKAALFFSYFGGKRKGGEKS